MTNDEATLRDLIRQMRAIAEPVGSMHGWWDAISDAEAHLAGKPVIVEMTTPEWIEHCLWSLAKHNAGILRLAALL